MQSISLNTARKLAIQSQFYSHSTSLKGKYKTLEIINQLGYVQIDTISVIARTHHHTLWVRQPDYLPEYLLDLQAKDRSIFEYWGHAMSYLPMEDFRFYINRMQKFKNPNNRWVMEFLKKSHHLLDPVKKRITEEGPLASKDFKPNKGEHKGPWWDWKPAKTALELLYWRGELMITERKNFQKVYDLTERVLPDGLNLTKPSEDELAEFLIKRALKAMGVATELEIRKFMQPDSARDSDFQAVDRKVLSRKIQELTEEEILQTVQIDSMENLKYYIAPKTLDILNREYKTSNQFFILSPFDNLIIQRDRIKKLFDYEYTLECYVPAAKRRYGYFSCPILWQDQLIGIVDPKADRKQKTLLIQNIYFEPNFIPNDSFFYDLGKQLKKMMLFNQCERIKLIEASPSKYKTAIQKMIR